MKKILSFIFLLLFCVSLTSCELPQINFGGGGSSSKTEESTEESNKKTPVEDEKTKDDAPTKEQTQQPTVDEPTKEQTQQPTDDSTLEEDLVKKYTIKDPSFTTRKVASIDEITMDDFFNLGNRVDINIHISSTELSKLQDDYRTGYKSEVYRLANKVEISLTNKGTTYKWEYENVGIRQKGNTSRREIYDGNGNLNLNHYKLSFDETFNDINMYDSTFINKFGNDEYKDREFLGMSGLDFKWDKNYDATHIREVYANYLYRACGILAQHSGLSTLSLVETSRNNKSTSMGLCTVYEPATKSFIKRSLKSEDTYINMSDWSTEKDGLYGVEGEKYGDLYKCIYGADLTNSSISGSNIGISNISGTYVPLYDRKTNKDAVYQDTLLRNAVSAISSSNYDNISKYVDLEYLAISEAVGYFVGNPDSMRYNMNNYMIYMRRTDGKMVFIPIDSDRCFGIIKDWNPRDGYMYTTPLDRKDSTGKNTISLLLNTILSNSDNEAKNLYLEYIDKLSNSAWLTNDCFNTFYNMAKSSYSGYNFSLNDDQNNYSFNKYITNKLNTVKGNNNDNGGNNTPSTSSYDVYLVSSLNGFNANSDKYKMTKINDSTYTITITVDKLEENSYIKFKFNNGGQDYSKVDWTVDQNTHKLVLSKGSSYKYYGVSIGDKLTITINTDTLDVIIEKNK